MTLIKNKIIDGILLLDKPLHITSNGALQQVKRLFGAKKAGHTGSLDPLATGMLPICFGRATKLSQKLLESDKYYDVTARLGEKTQTGDAEGEIIEKRPASHVTLELLQSILPAFTGVIEQIPPMYSALKHKGKPLYQLARQGIEVARQPRQVTIHKLELLTGIVRAADDPEVATVSFHVHCTKGTYIRTLMEDIGEALGCGAHVIRLRRTAVAPYLNTPMVRLSQIEEACQADGQQALLRFLLPST